MAPNLGPVAQLQSAVVMSGTVYILRNRVNKCFYIGSTADFNKRLRQHEKGKDQSSKIVKPFDLVFTQGFSSLKAAREVERKLKSYKRRDFIEKIIEDGFIHGPIAQSVRAVDS